MTETSEFKSGYVAVMGKPNVGKSTLINAVMGQKIAAVSAKPQTTRKQQLGILTTDEAQIIFMDTPGIHKEYHKLGGLMNEEARAALEENDLALFIVDLSASPDEEDQALAEILEQSGDAFPVILVLNKADLVHEDTVESRQRKYQELLETKKQIVISATDKTGLDHLMEIIIEELPEGPIYYDPEQVTDLYERDIASDLIREAALTLLKKEVPHSIAIRIDEFTERGEDGAYIEATMFVERDSQKAIVIGKGGTMMKKIGAMARKEIEKMSGRKIFLRIRVKVRKNWRNDDGFLSRFNFKTPGE